MSGTPLAETAERFLEGHRFAVIGAGEAKNNFGGTIYTALLEHGYAVVPVNRSGGSLAGQDCYPNVRDVPGQLDGAIVMVRREAASAAVQDCLDRKVPRIWLFKGLGSPGAESDEAVQLCRAAGVDVVAGACPLMFLRPVRGVHRLHRSLRRLKSAPAH